MVTGQVGPVGGGLVVERFVSQEKDFEWDRQLVKRLEDGGATEAGTF